MQDISLHLLDIIENSVRAGATLVKVLITADIKRDKLTVVVDDNGCGMDEQTLLNAQDPFYTTKSERQRKVGLGIPLFKQNAEQAGGYFTVQSAPGRGTCLTAVFGWSNIDRPPLGDISGTMVSAMIGHEETDFYLQLDWIDDENVTREFDSGAIKAELDGVPLSYPEVIGFISESLQNMIKETNMEEK